MPERERGTSSGSLPACPRPVEWWASARENWSDCHPFGEWGSMSLGFSFLLPVSPTPTLSPLPITALGTRGGAEPCGLRA